MGKYGEVALRATSYLKHQSVVTPQDAWRKAVKEVFPGSNSSQNKGCPRGAYLGLCEEGMVSGVPEGSYTRSCDNKRYAIDAVRALSRQPSLANDRIELWSRIMSGLIKKENSQMDVVVELWRAGLIVKEKGSSGLSVGKF